MLFSAVALLAFAGLVAAAPPAAQATYCSEDNLLRAFQHTPTPASKYCVATSGYPSFLAVATYPSSRLSSACSCFSRIPSETPKAACTPGTVFTFSGTADAGTILNLVITASSTTPCGDGTGFTLTSVCGTYNGLQVTFNAADAAGYDCVYTSTGTLASTSEIYFKLPNGDVILLINLFTIWIVSDETTLVADYYINTPPTVVDVSCSGSSACPK